MSYFTDWNGPIGGPHEIDFGVFSNSEMNVTKSQSEKNRCKNGIVCLVSMFHSSVIVFKLSRKLQFLQFCADLSRKAVYYVCNVFYVITYYLGDIRVWSWRFLLNFCWLSIFFYFLIANISYALAQIPINHIIFWKSVMWTFKFIYVNTFIKLRFFAEVGTKLQKLRFFGQFKDHKVGRKHGN